MGLHILFNHPSIQHGATEPHAIMTGCVQWMCCDFVDCGSDDYMI